MHEARENVARALWKMASLNDVIQDNHGNVSQRDGDDFYIKPSGMPYSEIMYADVCKISMDRPKDDGNLRTPSVDTIHHRAIYKRWKDIGAICHTHSPFATAYAYNHKVIRCLGTEQADFFGDDIYTIGYSDLNSWGEEASKYLHNGIKATLLVRHGVLTFGKTAEEAVKLAAALENCARKNYLAETLFNNDSRMQLESLPDSEIKKWHDRYYNVYGQK